MSHLKERKEKECLNCNAIIYGRFCHVCGQENVEPKETFLHLLRHFIEDITHFDGKFFDTLKYLLFRPGFLSYEYMRGRRNSYLNPIRMYVFTSAIFFLVYFSVRASHDALPDKGGVASANNHNTTKLADTTVKANSINTYTSKSENKIDKKTLKDSFTVLKKRLEDSIKNVKNAKDKKGLENELQVVKTVEKVTNKFTYYSDDSLDDGIISNEVFGLSTKKIKKEKSRNFLDEIFGTKEEVSHNVPKVMFVTLPLMALILQLLYRRAKQFFYVNHLIFTLHLYVAIFLIFLLGIGVDYLYNYTGWRIFLFLFSMVGFTAFFYTYKAMRNFYLLKRGKTFFKCFTFYAFFLIIYKLSLLLFIYTTSLNAH